MSENYCIGLFTSLPDGILHGWVLSPSILGDRFFHHHWSMVELSAMGFEHLQFFLFPFETWRIGWMRDLSGNCNLYAIGMILSQNPIRLLKLWQVLHKTVLSMQMRANFSFHGKRVMKEKVK